MCPSLLFPTVLPVPEEPFALLGPPLPGCIMPRTSRDLSWLRGVAGVVSFVNRRSKESVLPALLLGESVPEKYTEDGWL